MPTATVIDGRIRRSVLRQPVPQPVEIPRSAQVDALALLAEDQAELAAAVIALNERLLAQESAPPVQPQIPAGLTDKLVALEAGLAAARDAFTWCRTALEERTGQLQAALAALAGQAPAVAPMPLLAPLPRLLAPPAGTLPDNDIVVTTWGRTGHNTAPTPASAIRITPTGGSQMTLGDALGAVASGGKVGWVNVQDYPGVDPTGAADSTPAFLAAIATGRDVYAPYGSYLIRNQLVLTNGQELFGDGRGTTLLVDQTFNAMATGVIALGAREQFSPTVRDLNILFAQPADQTSRANFLTLAQGGTSVAGGTGIKYPPAIIISNSNRFKLRNLRISRAWDGIINAAGNTIGGFFIRDIEMSAFDCGLSLDQVFDFGHVIGYHMWAFDISTALLQGVWWDGNTFAAKIGVNADYGIGCFHDFCCYDSRLQIAGANSATDFYGLHMDGNNATLEISNGNQHQICGVYFSGTPTGANPSTAQCNISGGKVIITNIYSQVGSGFPVIAHSGGFLIINGGELLGGANNQTLIQQSGGRSYISGIMFATPASAAWTVPIVNVAAGSGVIMFHGNMIEQPAPAGGNVGALAIATDSALHSVGGNAWNGWSFTPPGTLGSWGFNDDLIGHDTVTMNGSLVLNVGGESLGNFQIGNGSVTQGVGLFLHTAAGYQRDIAVYSSNVLRWAAIFDNSAESGSNAGCNFAFNRYDDSGSLLGSAITINRATGQITLSATGVLTSVAGNLSIAGQTTTSGTTVQTAASGGASRNIYLQTAGVNRWLYGATASAETGSNAGCNFAIQRCSDAGATIDSPLTINRATGVVGVIDGLSVGAGGSPPTVTAGTGAPASTQPNGSQYIRSDGATGSRLYISAGAGTWNAVAGV